MQLLNNSYLFYLFVRYAFFTIQYSTAVSVQSKCNNSYYKFCFTLLYCFQYFKELFIYLTTFVAWSCYPKFAHGKILEISKHSAHGKIFAHNFLVICGETNHHIPKFLLIVIYLQKVTQTLIKCNIILYIGYLSCTANAVNVSCHFAS